MNCRQTGGDLACYVTNYGLPDQNLANADAAEARVSPRRPGRNEEEQDPADTHVARKRAAAEEALAEWDR